MLNKYENKSTYSAERNRKAKINSDHRLKRHGCYHNIVTVLLLFYGKVPRSQPRGIHERWKMQQLRCPFSVTTFTSKKLFSV